LGSAGPGAYFAPTLAGKREGNNARSNLGQGYWECRQVGGTHTRDTGEKYLLRGLARFLLSELRIKTKNIIKSNCGQSVAWSDFGELFLQAAGAFSAPFHALDLTPELRGL